LTGFSMYQGVTDQVVMSGTPGFFSVPRGAISFAREFLVSGMLALLAIARPIRRASSWW
jgi:hypothetical protein